jgi:hypothetical protein
MKWKMSVALAAGLVATPAMASPCGQRVAALQKRYETAGGNGAAAKPDLQGSAPQTTGAMLHHQPTQGSVAGAERSADSPDAVRSAKFQVMIEQARAADNANDAKECEVSANEAEKALR